MRDKGGKKAVKVVLMILITLAVFVAGTLLYFKYFVTPLDKTGMVYEDTEQTSNQVNTEDQNQNGK